VEETCYPGVVQRRLAPIKFFSQNYFGDVNNHSGGVGFFIHFTPESIFTSRRNRYKQIFDMAIAEGHVERNPALLLFTPKEAAKPVRRVMNIKDLFRGARPKGTVDRQARRHRWDASRRDFRAHLGPLNGHLCGHPAARVSRAIDTPKTDQSVRKAALPEGLLRDIELWREFAVEPATTPGCFRPRE
jgi:hypothetical protein